MSHKIYEMKFIVILFFVLLCVNSNAQNDYDLAESYFDDGEFEKALYYYKKLNNLQPGNSKFIFRIVKIYQELEIGRASCRERV